MSLRLKLLLVLIGLVIVGLTVSDVVTYTSLRSFLLQRVDQQLLAGRFPVAAALERGGVGAPGDHGPPDAQLPPGTFGEVKNAAGKVVGSSVMFTYGGTPNPVPDLPTTLPVNEADANDPAFFTVGAVGGSSLHYRVLAQPLTGGQGSLIVAIPLTEVDQTLGRLLLIAGSVTGGVVIVLGLLSWWLVRRELRPLREIGVTAGAIAAGDLSQRVAQEDPRTEVGQLGLALNAMLAQIEQAFAERKASEERLRRFLADASHELRTPLTSIRGYAELFRRGANEREEDLRKSMRRIEEESARMGVLVEDLLLIARLDQDRPLEREHVDLAKLAGDSVADARAADPGRVITLDASEPVVVFADEARLRQVAGNLIANALVHTPPGTPVTVRVMAEDGDAVLEVADGGPGLSPEQVERAFEPFYRSDPSRDRATGGAGLGLSIVAAIARAHGGRIDVRTTPGGGATFRVLIPQEQAASEADEPASVEG